MTGWRPPSIEFPDTVQNVREFFDKNIHEILESPPLLNENALQESCKEFPETKVDNLRRGQDALRKGDIHNAHIMLEPEALTHPHAAALSGLACYALGRVERAVFLWDALFRVFGLDDKPSLYNSFINLGHAMMKQDNSLNPEADTLSIICKGKGIDVGCGGNKTCPEAIGVDLTAYGDEGIHGGQRKIVSSADIVASGDYLPMFESEELDYVIARHNLEHYQDYVKTLFEWTRVLKPGGLMGIVAPDQRWVDTISLDPTHYHVFTVESLQNIFSLLPSIEPIHVGVMLPRWSIVALTRKTPVDSRYDFAASINKRERERVAAQKAIYEKEKNLTLAAECATEMEWLGNNQKAGMM